MQDLERAIGAKLRDLEEQVYRLKRQQLDALIDEQLLAEEAAEQGGSVAALLDAELTARVELLPLRPGHRRLPDGVGPAGTDARLR